MKMIFKKPAPIPHKNCRSKHHFSPHFIYTPSEQYYTSDLSEIYMTLYS